MNESERYSSFIGDRHLFTGDLKGMLSQTHAYISRHGEEGLLIFDNFSGRQIDYNFRVSLEELLGKELPPTPKKGPGRPRLGVVCGEISLLPRHWDWLQRQRQSASATIRRLIEAAMKEASPEEKTREAIDAAGKFLWTMAGNLSDFEEASRALYAQKWHILDAITAAWPEDIAKHLNMMLKATGKQ